MKIRKSQLKAIIEEVLEEVPRPKYRAGGIKEELKEGTWAIPNTQKKYNELKKLMKRPIILGKDAEKATDKLYHLMGDDDLFDQLEDAADNNAKGDARPYVKEFLKLWAKELKKKGIKESFNTAPAGQGKEAASVIGTDEDKDVSEWNKSDDEAAAHGKRREKEIGSLASSSKSKALVKKMHDMVSKKLKLQSIEDVQPIKDGIAFIFGDSKDAKKMAAHLKKAGSLGKVMKLASGGGKRTMVSLKT